MTTLALNKRTGEFREVENPDTMERDVYARIRARTSDATRTRVAGEMSALVDYDPLADEWLPCPVEQPEPAPLEWGDVAAAGIAMGKVVGVAIWFVLAVPLGIVAHIGKALFTPSETKPEPPAYGSRRPNRERRFTYEETTFYHHKKFTSE